MLLLFLLPLLFACTLPKQKLAFFFSLVPLTLLLSGQTESVQENWFLGETVKFHLALDTLSLVFVYLVAILIPICILVQESKFCLTLLLQGLLIGFFSAQDLMFFTFFFEAILIPLFFMLQRPFKFIIYMIAGSSLMILGALSLYLAANSFDLTYLKEHAERIAHAEIYAFIFLLAFAVKTPLFPLHGWLADSYTLAPTSATILLSSLLSKAGIYGIIRIAFGLFPTIMSLWNPVLLLFAIGGVLYGAFAAWGQNDYKRLIAYSSLSHVNFILVGLFAGTLIGLQGAIFASVNHSITIAGLFIVSGWLEMRLGTTTLAGASGLTATMPKLSWITLFFILSSVALPGLNNFISEIMVLYGLFQISFWQTLLVGTTVIFSVIYMLKWFHTVYFNAPQHNGYSDIQAKEVLILTPLIVLILVLGIYPSIVLTLIQSIT